MSHVINENSPLYRIDETLLRSGRLELIASIQGVDTAMKGGSSVSIKHSYNDDRILWGHE